ncbi:MAG: sensor histidine kinase [Salinivirgaceae bacterium]
MKHPITQKLRFLLIYSAIWLVIMGIHIGTLTFMYKISLGYALADALIFNTLYAFLGVALWYPVFYNNPEKQSFSNLIINHLSIMSLSLAFWISLGIFISKLLFNESDTYLEFVEDGITWRIFTGIFFYFIIVMLYYLYIYGQNLKEHMMQESRLREKINEAELQTLKSQINPHFLFNSLNSLSSLTITNPEKAHEMIIKLSGFLRYSLAHDPNKLIPLRQEIENVESYIAVEKIRFGEKLIFEKEINQACYEHKVPFLILQPLIENAIKHGVYESTEPITLKISCKPQSDASIQITISNNFDPEALPRKGTGTGIKNIIERLRIIYQLNDLFTYQKTENSFEVQIIVPSKPAFKESIDM